MALHSLHMWCHLKFLVTELPGLGLFLTGTNRISLFEVQVLLIYIFIKQFDYRISLDSGLQLLRISFPS